MAIVKEYEEYYLECDACGRCVNRFDTFDDALDYAKEMGWTIKRDEGDPTTWATDCNDCLEW